MKKVVSFLLAGVLFFQSSNFAFANQLKNIVVDGTIVSIEENDDVKICTSSEEIGNVIVTLDKYTNIMTQKVTDPSTGELLSLQTWDLSKHNNKANVSSDRLKSKKSCHNWCGYNYWLDEDPDTNCLYCEKHDGQSKAVFLDMTEKSAIKAAYKFADKSEEIRMTEWALDGSVFLVICELFFPGGKIAKTISKSALVELGIPGGVVMSLLKLHQQALEADDLFSQI